MIRGRERRHKHIRKKMVGTPEKPRMCVFRSLKNMYVQFVDDVSGKTLFSVSTTEPELAKAVKYGGNVKAALMLGERAGKRALEKGIKKVVFDRAGYLYHGRVKAVADAARKAGLEF